MRSRVFALAYVDAATSVLVPRYKTQKLTSRNLGSRGSGGCAASFCLGECNNPSIAIGGDLKLTPSSDADIPLLTATTIALNLCPLGARLYIRHAVGQSEEGREDLVIHRRYSFAR